MPRILVCDEGPAANRLRDQLLAGQPGLRVQLETTHLGAKAKLSQGGYDVYVLGFSRHAAWAELLQRALKAGAHTRLICVLEDLNTEQESNALGIGVADVITRADATGANLRRALRHAIARSVRSSIPDTEYSEAVSSGGAAALSNRRRISQHASPPCHRIIRLPLVCSLCCGGFLTLELDAQGRGAASVTSM